MGRMDVDGFGSPDRDRRILEALVRARSLLRAEGNPYHDAEGKFTGAGGQGHGKHHAKRQRRKLRRQRQAQAIRRESKRGAAELKASHRAERREHVRDERKARVELGREHAKERKAQARTHAREKTTKLREHAKEGAKHAKRWAKQREKVGKEHAAKATKLNKAEQQAGRLPKRHERERAKLEEHISSGGHAKDVAKVTADQVAKAKAAGKSPAEIEALEARGREVAAKGATQARERLAQRHEAEKAKAAGIPALKERLVRQTVAKLKRVESGPARLAKHQAKQLKAMGRRHVRERRELRDEHRDARASLREDQVADRQALRERHKEERQDIVERYEEELAEHGFKRKRKKGIGDGQRSLGSGGTGHESGVDGDPEQRSGNRFAVSGVGRGDHADGVGSGPIRRAMGRYRLHKASSAEAILKHCLRQRGWTGAFRRGELSGKQQLDLLQDIREYARAWLRHEAEALFQQHGRGDADSRDPGSIGGSTNSGVNHLSMGRTGRSGDRLGQGDREGGIESSRADRALSAALADHVGRFFRRARNFVHEAIVAGALALSGGEPLTAQDLEEADQQAGIQAAYLDRFHRDVHFRTPASIAEGEPAIEPMTAGQFVARAEMYGDAVHSGAQAVERARMVRGRVYVEERRLHGRRVDDMCATCAESVRRGWVSIGTLPPIGDSECIGQCHCYFQYRDAAGNVAKTVRRDRGKPLLKRRPVVGI